MLKVLELFAGIGACSSALTRLGIEYEIVDAVEIDRNRFNYAPEALAKIFRLRANKQGGIRIVALEVV